MPLELPVPKVEAPKLSGSLPSFTTTPTVSVGNSGFSSPSTGNLVNVSSLSSNGIKSSVAPPLDLKSIKPSVNLGGKVNINAESIKSLTTKQGLATTISAVASGMNIPVGLPSTTDALKTLGVPTNLAGLQKALDFKLPQIPAFPGINFALLLGKSPKFIAEVVLKYKTICLPHVPGLTINMGQALAAISIIKAVASGQGGAIVKHLLEGIAGELKAELVGQLQKSISAGLKETEDSLKSVLNDAAKTEIGFKVKNQKDEYDPDTGELLPKEEVEASFDTDIDLGGDNTYESSPEDPNIAYNPMTGEPIVQTTDSGEAVYINQDTGEPVYINEVTGEPLPTGGSQTQSEIIAAAEQTSADNAAKVANQDTGMGTVTSQATTAAAATGSAESAAPNATAPSPVTTPSNIPYGLTAYRYEGIKQMTRIGKIADLRRAGNRYSSNANYATSTQRFDVYRQKFEKAAASLEKYSWVYPWEEGWTESNRWSDSKIDFWISFSSDNIPGENGVPAEW